MRSSEDRKQKALELLKLFLDSGELIKERKGKFLKREEFQEWRRKVSSEIRELIDGFLRNRLSLNSFKSEVDSINKRNPLWGFSGIKGQMFFNQLFKAVDDKSSLTKKLQEAISLPKDIKDAEQKLNRFWIFVYKLGKRFSDRHLAPKEGSAPYFLSYFWQIQDPEKFPIYYTSLEQVFIELDFMPSDIDKSGEKYKFFYNLNNEFKELFSKKTGRNFSYWDVEHVFWYYYNQKQEAATRSSIKKEISAFAEEIDYMPPIIKEIPALARGDEKVVKKYEKESKKVEDVLEDKIYKLFIMLGYEVKKLGKGKGREPDGIARARQDSYAIIYDAKSRKEGYSIGTDDRAIKEYIESHSKILKKEGFRNIYFIVISGSFRGNQENSIKNIKMETDAQEILLLKADFLLFILELKLRDSAIDLSSLQKVFHNSGILSKEDIQEYLAGR